MSLSSRAGTISTNNLPRLLCSSSWKCNTWSLNYNRFIWYFFWVSNPHVVHVTRVRPSVSWTWKDTGPIWSNMVPSNHVGTPTKFRTCTQSPIWNALALVCLSCPWFCLAWLSLTFTPVSGCNRSNRDLGCLPNSSSAGDRPVVVWGVILYLNKNLDNLVSSDPPWIHLIPCLKVWTALSANPFEAGWYGAVCVCVTPFVFKKSSNSSLVNTAPLSVTILSGRPCVAKMTLSFSIVAADVAAWTGMIHLEWASTNTRNIRPKNGPA